MAHLKVRHGLNVELTADDFIIQDFCHKDVTFEKKFIFDKKVDYDLFLAH